MRNLEAATGSAARMAVQLDKFSQTVNTKGGLADKLFTDTVTFNKLTATAAQFQQTAKNAAAITDNLTKATNKFNTNDNAIGILLNDQAAATQVRSTISNLQQSSVKLNDNMLALQSNFFLKGFFKKREKAKQDSIKAAEKLK